jgi:hypothetical protein
VDSETAFYERERIERELQLHGTDDTLMPGGTETLGAVRKRLRERADKEGGEIAHRNAKQMRAQHVSTEVLYTEEHAIRESGADGRLTLVPLTVPAGEAAATTDGRESDTAGTTRPEMGATGAPTAPTNPTPVAAPPGGESVGADKPGGITPPPAK